VVARDARGWPLIDPEASPRLGGPSEVVRRHGEGLLAIAGGPGRLRRVSRAERATHWRKYGCICGVCRALHAPEVAAPRPERHRLTLEPSAFELEDAEDDFPSMGRHRRSW